VLAFIRPDQPQSRAALEQIKSAVATVKDVQVIVVSNGGRVETEWPVVADPEFATSGQFDVHSWPTVVVVKSDGAQAAHLAGMRATFASDLEDYLAFASGAIDQAALKHRLSEHEVVGGGDGGKIDRHLVLATQLLESGRLDDAAAQLNEGLKLRPRDPKLTILLARAHVLRNEPAEALRALEELQNGSIPAWQKSLLRAQALVALDRWDDARPLLPETLKLNPNPAEAHYLVGLLAQHDAKWQEAAEAFRLAYESEREHRKRAAPRPAAP
jgi:tetratricopeptide (TPR) repeat protein